MSDGVSTRVEYELERHFEGRTCDWVDVVKVYACIDDGDIYVEAHEHRRIITEHTGAVSEVEIWDRSGRGLSDTELTEEEMEGLRSRLRPKAIELCRAILDSVGAEIDSAPQETSENLHLPSE
jgi:hypothetical protein